MARNPDAYPAIFEILFQFVKVIVARLNFGILSILVLRLQFSCSCKYNRYSNSIVVFFCKIVWPPIIY